MFGTSIQYKSGKKKKKKKKNSCGSFGHSVNFPPSGRQVWNHQNDKTTEQNCWLCVDLVFQWRVCKWCKLWSLYVYFIIAVSNFLRYSYVMDVATKLENYFCVSQNSPPLNVCPDTTPWQGVHKSNRGSSILEEVCFLKLSPAGGFLFDTTHQGEFHFWNEPRMVSFFKSSIGSVSFLTIPWGRILFFNHPEESFTFVRAVYKSAYRTSLIAVTWLFLCIFYDESNKWNHLHEDREYKKKVIYFTICSIISIRGFNMGYLHS